MKNALWPSHLALLYPHPQGGLVWREVFAAAVVLAMVTALVLLGRRHGYLPVGWFWFLGTLVPMLGIVQVGIQAMADRYAYISFIGLFIMICWGVAELAEHTRMPNLLVPALSVVTLFALGTQLRHQIAYWAYAPTLWQHTVEITHNNWEAEKLWGGALLDARRPAEAMPHFEKILRYEPQDALVNRALGLNDMWAGKYGDAIPHLEIAVKDKDTKPEVLRETYVALAKAYWEVGNKEESRNALQASRAIVVP